MSFYSYFTSKITIFILLIFFSGVLVVPPLKAQEIQKNDTITADALYKKARIFAFNGQHAEARKLCRQALVLKPEYFDASVLIGRTYSWDKMYDSARIELKKVLAVKYGHKDASLALIDVELWSGNPVEGLKIAEIALSFNPNDQELLLKKAKALASSGKNEEASDILNNLLEKNPANTDAQQLLKTMKENSILNKVSLNYAYDFFDPGYFTPGNLAYFDYGRRTKYGTVIGRINYANSFKKNDFQFEADAYPQLRKGTYMYLNAGFSDNNISHNIFPVWRFGAEIYQTLPKSFEVTAGIRYLKFSSSDVMIYTGSVGKYYKNYWFSLRTFFSVKQKNGISQSLSLITRRYFSSADNFLSLTLGLGASPDDKSIMQNDPTIYHLKSQKIYLEYQQVFAKRFIGKAGFGYQNEEYYQGKYRNRFTLECGAAYKF
jgi:YaiO family outer membrane protein